MQIDHWAGERNGKSRFEMREVNDNKRREKIKELRLKVEG